MPGWRSTVRRVRPTVPNPPTVFNTGQVLFGFARAFEETGNATFRDALHRAANWLVDAQDSDGAWRRFPSPFAKPGANPYNTRTAFGFVRAFHVCRDERFLNAAVANAEWAARQARPNGWLTGNCLTPHCDDRGLTHTIAYAMRGLLEVGLPQGAADLVDHAVVWPEQQPARSDRMARCQGTSGPTGTEGRLVF